MTTTPTRFRLPDPDDLTLQDAYVIRLGTNVDIFKPPTVGHRNAAMLWFGAKRTDDPISWAQLEVMSSSDLVDLFEARVLTIEEADAADAADREDPVPEPMAAEGKASAPESSTTSGSPGTGESVPPS